MKKLIFIFALGLGLSTAAFAGAPKTNDVKSDTKSDTNTPAKTEDALAYFEYIGPQPPASGDLTKPANYGNTQVNPNDLCSTGSLGCAAQFTVDGSGHSGSPSDIRTKDEE